VVSCTSLGGINIRMSGFVIQVIIYILRSEQEQLREMQGRRFGKMQGRRFNPTRGPCAAFYAAFLVRS
jgi:hypothetical protein